jgi:DNA excision repair protein ERCC-4
VGQIGDYVLSPEMCVERKSLADLRQSFLSGRLYHQVEAMTKHYKTPILLIEFERDKAFVLQSSSDLGSDINVRLQCLSHLLHPESQVSRMPCHAFHDTTGELSQLQLAPSTIRIDAYIRELKCDLVSQGHTLGSKLVLLTLHFPRLRIIWSRSLHATADIFRALKSNQDEPDPAVAALLGTLSTIFPACSNNSLGSIAPFSVAFTYRYHCSFVPVCFQQSWSEQLCEKLVSVQSK